MPTHSKPPRRLAGARYSGVLTNHRGPIAFDAKFAHFTELSSLLDEQEMRGPHHAVALADLGDRVLDGGSTKALIELSKGYSESESLVFSQRT